MENTFTELAGVYRIFTIWPIFLYRKSDLIMVSAEELCYNLAGERRQIPRCKQRGIKLAAPQGAGL